MVTADDRPQTTALDEQPPRWEKRPLTNGTAMGFMIGWVIVGPFIAFLIHLVWEVVK